MAPGLDVGLVIALHVHGSHVWIGGNNGLALYDGQRVQNLKRRDGKPFTYVGGIVELDNGDVWLHDRALALRVPAASLKTAMSDPLAAVAVEVFDEADGLYGAVSGTSPLPSLIQGTDGRLWFATDAGLAWLDPVRFDTAVRQTRLHVRTLVADGHDYAGETSPTLAALNKRVEVSYTAIALSIPERIRFRYRLEGLDGDWQDAGSRRTAYFNDLPPGDYRFRVKATDENGVWRDDDGVLAFKVAAAWYQTLWFRLFCLAVALAVLWALFQLRSRQLTARIAAREEVKQLERSRIARDLHDTFLQSVHGLMWHFQALTSRIPPGDPVRARLDDALRLADQVLVEGRDRVIDLRQVPIVQRGLTEALEAAWTEASVEAPHPLAIGIRGKPRPLRDHARNEVFNILREALINVHRHA